MDKLLTSIEIAEALQCSRDCALVLMQKMRHVDVSSSSTRRNLRVWETDFKRWLDERSKDPDVPRKRGRKPTNDKTGVRMVPYRHAEREGVNKS